MQITGWDILAQMVVRFKYGGEITVVGSGRCGSPQKNHAGFSPTRPVQCATALI